MCPEQPILNICTLPGLTPYSQALELQEALQACRIRKACDDTLLLLQHPPVLTLGTRGHETSIYARPEELKAAGVTVHRVNRGGDVTYHGPGQLVGYPIVDLHAFPGRIRGFVAALEMAIIDLLKQHFAIQAEAGTGRMTGIWVGDAKICAIGLSVSRGVTLHGFALNINTNLHHFDWINPCGLSRPVTSLASLLGTPVEMAQIIELTARFLASSLQRSARSLEPCRLMKLAGLAGGHHTDEGGVPS
jgi:lipoyl(octanoyl) transferase